MFPQAFWDETLPPGQPPSKYDKESGYSWHGVWMCGVGLASLSILLSSVGLTLQRAAHMMEAEEGTTRRLTRRKRRLILGLVLYISASAPDVVSYALLPQSIASNISCCRLMLVAVLAHVYLGERITRVSAMGIVLCIVGTVLCLNFGPGPDMHLDKNPRSFFRPSVCMYLAVGAAILACLLLLEHVDEICQCRSHKIRKMKYFSLPMATSLAYGIEKVFNTGIGFAPHDWWEPQWLFCYAAIGLLGLMDFYLNMRGVKKMPVQVFVPAAFATGTGICYFQSVVIFRELSYLGWVNFAVSLAGMLLSLVGALCIQMSSLSSASSEWEVDAAASLGSNASWAEGGTKIAADNARSRLNTDNSSVATLSLQATDNASAPDNSSVANLPADNSTAPGNSLLSSAGNANV